LLEEKEKEEKKNQRFGPYQKNETIFLVYGVFSNEKI